MQGQTIHIDHLTKRFGAVVAVDDLTFTVMPGRVTGFLGPNGAGKTTTLRMLLGLVRPTAGTANFAGLNYVDMDEPLRQVGAHLAADAFHPGRTGRDHLRVMATGSGLGSTNIQTLLELVDLARDADRRVGEYSLGMRQRLGLAAALLGDPPVLILDEPANGLDPEGISWLRGFLRARADEGRTVFLSSHLLGEVQQMAHDVVIIDQGRLVASGPVEELEKGSGGVLVASSHGELLGRALEAADLKFTRDANGTYTVRGTNPEDIGNLALVAGVSLTHLAEESTGLEELFLSVVGGGR